MAKVIRQKVTKKSVKPKSRPSSGSSFLDGIADITIPDTGIKISLYGKSGSGKTTLACSFPKPALLIRVGMDDGVRSVHNVKGVKVTPIVNSTANLNDVVAMQREDQPYKTIILDNASELQSVILKEVLDLAEAPTQLSWGVARQQDWGDVAMGMKDNLRNILALSELGTHVVIIAQERTFGESEDNGILAPNVMSALTPSVVGWLNPAVDYVAQCYIRMGTKTVTKTVGKKTIKREVSTGKPEFCLRIGPHEIFTTKFRAPKGTEVPECIVDPSFEKLEALIEGS